MKLTFESNLQHQQYAIKSITDLFEGQPLEDSIVEYSRKEKQASLIQGVSNNLMLRNLQILNPQMAHLVLPRNTKPTLLKTKRAKFFGLHNDK
jgi:restriction endonuclease